VLYAVLQLLALARYGQEVAWSRPAAWLYVLLMLSVLAIGLYGWWQSTRVVQIHERPPTSAAVG
jgi:hypothetical protein